MTHGLQDNVSVLRRWAAHGGSQLPTNWRQFEAENFAQAQHLRKVDPDLVALLSGNASASLRADALTGKFSQVPPDYEQQQRQAAFDRKEALVKKMRAGEANLSERIELEARAPEDYKRLQAEAAPSQEQVLMAQRQKAAADAQMKQESVQRATAQMRMQARRQF